ncbi:MAG TPA: hemerythrin domain-containing protein [Anaeromyxobacteraceae bacterium]|nr:hemerythrin domain-containing protein [Anaeromyxobacteraceae bacterium]
MDAIDLLMEEHRLILGACDALAAFGRSVAAGGGDKAELGRFVRFIREFADARHHGKEEDILFTAMVAAGFPRDGGPIAVMLMDHEAGRAHVGVLAARAEQPAPWSAQDRAAIAGAAAGYADLLRGHIRKEDHILYPMARMRLHEAQIARVNQECAAFEERQAAAGADSLLDLGRELVSRHPAAP